MKEKKIYEEPRFMTIQECVEQLFEILKNKEAKAYQEETRCFGLARVGYPDQKIKAGAMKEFLKEEMGAPLHSFVICAEQLHSIEREMF